ncbi:MAG: two-component system response regulator [Nitrospinae bacterium RIFCSPLOWO2_02_FULL_39_110]|nr:MAG: two-component system response regulator [Nitrospinae bacterium RIFCSPHIGHO2_02_39_11]OGV98331.1 MAG: two-component system response regulator [Nitrospinae bacterium RIFCSPHIGHO2_12_FULL_39_42]OGW05141.1 MAG: two-component system response regulator [Nitrospinae bacterium RIFCSPLOWO2_02_39_17]OGW06894.1 MAG: two-component system response regulator [Nitrospinae bacterium RIFCSPLOWO2_02_FULL_39_110]OGW07561.1 MAG: two-component system response regulator [Nitrospinae bacterium RIFCSPLOWO2_12_
MSQKILVIEDNDKNRLLIRDILRYYGYEVLEATDGEEGIKMAKEHKPALIFMDMQMPVMNGFNAINILKGDAETKDIKIIAVTSFAMKEEKEIIMKAGADDYMAKPIDTRQLPLMMKRVLGN